jgi:cellulose synthase/poly-beta-1,6-N-acetylglucosamine synthase-like glycosyltransferase
MFRQAIDQSGGLDFVAQTGTDYQLALRLIASGFIIRFVHTSMVPTEYPETLDVYQQRQSRWLRNLLIYGLRYGAKSDVWATLRTIAVGALMLLTPLVTFVTGRVTLVLWLLLVAHAASSKLRYMLFTARLHRRPVPTRLLAGVMPLTLIDFAIWALPLLDLLDPRRRQRW